MYSIYELLWMFLIYSFLGWCAEVAWCGVGDGVFVNRGFLNGPVCPIYGVGGVVVILCLSSIKNLFLLFICSMVITSVIELITGFVLEKIYNTRWWDYSDMPFNIGGYICLKYSILWGFACIGLMRVIHPIIYKLIGVIPETLGWVMLALLPAVFAADIVVTILTINKLSKRMKLMRELADKIHSVSDGVGEHIYDGVTAAVKKGEEIRDNEKIRELVAETEELKEKYEKNSAEIREKYSKELAELKEKYAKLTNDRSILQKRILEAFPKLKSGKYSEQLEELKERLRKPKNK
ncbi:MAG: hypothetical protein LIO59_00495 [Oscillospiraceae bacterium]|nr:hypothetical protein [Oscillospiraceae bacterium]